MARQFQQRRCFSVVLARAVLWLNDNQTRQRTEGECTPIYRTWNSLCGVSRLIKSRERIEARRAFAREKKTRKKEDFSEKSQRNERLEFDEKDISRECIFELSQLASFLARAFPSAEKRPRKSHVALMCKPRLRARAPVCACVCVSYILYTCTHTWEYINEDASTSVRIHRKRLPVANLAVKS